MNTESMAPSIRALELLEQQIFEAEETDYEEDPQTVAEIKAIQAEYEAGEYVTFAQYLSR